MVLEAWVTVLAISIFVLQFTNAVFKPLFLKLKWDVWWLVYIAFVVGFLVCFATGVNGFNWFPPGVGWVGRVLTALVCGAGPSTIYDMIDKGQPARLPEALK